MDKHTDQCEAVVNPVGTLCDCGYQHEQDEKLRTFKFRKMPYYCGPHGNKIVVFMNGVGGCRKCVDRLTKILQERRHEREKIGDVSSV